VPAADGDPLVFREDAPTIFLSHVVAGYGTRIVLDDVSLTAQPGQILGLVGPNGSGKTTLVRVASRGLRPMGGTVRIGDVDPYAVGSR
jgi:ABC-type multidrug transport system ATPase subunit